MGKAEVMGASEVVGKSQVTEILEMKKKNVHTNFDLVNDWFLTTHVGYKSHSSKQLHSVHFESFLLHQFSLIKRKTIF